VDTGKKLVQPSSTQDTAVVADRRTTRTTEPRHSPTPVYFHLFCTLFWDEPKNSRLIQNQVVQLARTMCKYAKEQAERYRHRAVLGRTKPLKIGYLSQSFCKAFYRLAGAVGIHHDRDHFQFMDISLIANKATFTEWYVNQVHQAYKGGIDGIEIAEKFTRMKLIF